MRNDVKSPNRTRAPSILKEIHVGVLTQKQLAVAHQLLEGVAGKATNLKEARRMDQKASRLTNLCERARTKLWKQYPGLWGSAL
jgi:hypothetical protein